MTFKNFEKLVMKYCSKVKKVTQRVNTQDNKVMVVFKGNDKAYLYRGSYSDILSRLGASQYICYDCTINHYKKAIKEFEDKIRNKETNSLFKKNWADVEKEYKNEISRLENELKNYDGLSLIKGSSGKEIGVFRYE